MGKSVSEQVATIVAALEAKKASDVVALDVAIAPCWADCMVVATGGVPRHIEALAREVREAMRLEGSRPLHVEGLPEGSWVLIDYGQVMVHLLLPTERERYRLEELWTGEQVVGQ